MRPVRVTLLKDRLAAICEKMALNLRQSAFSPNIRERRDFSCAIFDRDKRMLAMGAHIPVHLGAMPLGLKKILEKIELANQDVVVCNSPYLGGTHLPDISMVMAHDIEGAGRFYLVNRAHHADVGGVSPGSMPLATHIEQEGMLIEPLLLAQRGHFKRERLSGILQWTRTPTERAGDIKAQYAACLAGAEDLDKFVHEIRAERVSSRIEELMWHNRRVLDRVVELIPEGSWEATEQLESDGQGDGPLTIKVRITRSGRELTFDFAGSGQQARGNVNAPEAISISAVLYILRSLAGEEIPYDLADDGPIRVLFPVNSILSPRYPAAVAAGNVETSQRVTEAIISALMAAGVKGLPAQGQGTMNNLAFGDRYSAYYETLGGGHGAADGVPGLSGRHSHMTNSLNTPVEIVEERHPVRMREYSIRRGSGGAGKYPGGDGLVREYEFLAPLEVTMISERREIAPRGLNGGEDGAMGVNTLIRADGTVENLNGKFTIKVQKGDRLRIETPGGGGFGKA